MQSTSLSSGDADAESDDAAVPVSSLADPLSLLSPRRVHVFYFVRVSLLLLKLYLDSRMLGLFVRSMHASSSLMASTYNQCATIILAVSLGTAAAALAAADREAPIIAVPRADSHFLLFFFSGAASVLYFLCQGVCGATLFSESLSSSWLLGAALILAGVCCVQWGHS